jgi:hypothetical protein
MWVLLAACAAFAEPVMEAAEVDTTADWLAWASPDVDPDARVGIINGTPATVENWPQTGALLLRANLFGMSFTTMACSSSLIAPDTVLIAAHCVDPTVYSQQGIDISTAELYWSREPNPGMMIDTLPADAVRVSHRVLHESFDVMSLSMGVAVNNDIGLLFLESALTEVPLAVLPTAEEAAHIVEGAPVAVVGWGQTTTSQDSAGSKVYGTSHIAELGSHELKIGELETDVRKCHGDSGGPSFLEIETDSLDTWRQIGVTSHAYDLTDCDATGGVDTRIDPFLPWLDAQMSAACADGRRVWCDTPGVLPAAYPEEEAVACGCAASDSGSLMWLGLAIPLFLRRRGTSA